MRDCCEPETDCCAPWAFTPAERERLIRRWAEPSLWDSFLVALRRAGYALGVTGRNDPDLVDAALQELFENPSEQGLLWLLLQKFLQYEDAWTTYRNMHVQMVERHLIYGGSFSKTIGPGLRVG